MTLVMLSTTSIIIGVVVGVVVLGLLLFIASYVKAAPDTALIISGFGKRTMLYRNPSAETVRKTFPSPSSRT